MFLLMSCENNQFENQSLLNDQDNRTEDVSYLKSKFSYALAKVLSESKEVRELIKEEALKQFDYDYDVLYVLVKNKVIVGNETFEQLLLRYMDKDDLNVLIQKDPTLTIFVPYLYGNIFSAEKWNTDVEIPYVAYENDKKQILFVDNTGTVSIVKNNEMPTFPILVVKPSERVVLSSASTRAINNSLFIQTDSDISLMFEYDGFNNMTSATTRAPLSANDIPEDFEKIYNAKKLADKNNIWQRDYIYYGIQSKDDKGAYAKNISECIYFFELTGDAKNVFNIVSDQDDDPHYYDKHSWRGGGDNPTTIRRRRSSQNTSSSERSQKPFWYNGNFEFLVKLYVSNNQLVSNEIIKALSISPYDLFDLVVESNGRSSVATISGVKNLKRYYLPQPLPLFDWNIENYSASVKISIEEKDNQVTTQSVVETTTNFATNFSFDASYGEVVKLGAKFGASKSVQYRVSSTITTYLNSDQLGDVIINFGDDVVVSDELVEVDRSTDRRSGGTSIIYKPALNPKYTSGYCRVGIAPLPQY